ncbi:MAG: xanthine phosphoribosyltransferase [Eubacteriales bacterium]
MQLLENRIIKDGQILGGDILKVDSFLNHNIDIPFVNKLAEELHRLYSDCGVTKVLTIEASGIAIASLTALSFGVPMLFAKKSKSSNITGDVFCSTAHSYTHGCDNNIIVSKNFNGKYVKILIIDDFLAKGSALLALWDIAKQAGAELVGVGIVIEKEYQGGGTSPRKGLRIESLGKIKSMSAEDGIEFCR